MDGTRAHGRGHPRERVLVLAVRPDAPQIGRPTPEHCRPTGGSRQNRRPDAPQAKGRQRRPAFLTPPKSGFVRAGAS